MANLQKCQTPNRKRCRPIDQFDLQIHFYRCHIKHTLNQKQQRVWRPKITEKQMYKCHERWGQCRPVTFLFPIFASLFESFTNARQVLLAILQNISSSYNFPDDHTLFLFPVLFHLYSDWKRFQCSANFLLEELYPCSENHENATIQKYEDLFMFT